MSKVHIRVLIKNQVQINLMHSRRERGIHFNVGIPVPKVSLPDATYSYSHSLDYWPHKKFYTVNLSTVFKNLYKGFNYLTELAGLTLRVVFQIFDIFQMKKSYDALSHVETQLVPGWGWNKEDEDDRRRK